MLSLGEHILESYAHFLNTDRTILKLNPVIQKFGYEFIYIDASELEINFSEIFNVPKGDRPHTIIIGREPKGISHELHNAIVHSQALDPMFFNMEYPGLILLRKHTDFKIKSPDDFVAEEKEFRNFYSFVQNILLQLRLFKIGEIRCSQLFHISSTTRQISFRKREIETGSRGDYALTDNEAAQLSKKLIAKYETNKLTELAIKNFSLVYNFPDGLIRFITLMTCLESLFNLGKEQIAHTIARHLSIILSNNKEQFKENYIKIKKLYNSRNSIVHGGDYKGDIIQDYLELSNKVRVAINYCNVPNLTKEILFEDLNSRGFSELLK
jgi:hypothetical protein